MQANLNNQDSISIIKDLVRQVHQLNNKVDTIFSQIRAISQQIHGLGNLIIISDRNNGNRIHQINDRQSISQSRSSRVRQIELVSGNEDRSRNGNGSDSGNGSQSRNIERRSELENRGESGNGSFHLVSSNINFERFAQIGIISEQEQQLNRDREEIVEQNRKTTQRPRRLRQLRRINYEES